MFGDIVVGTDGSATASRAVDRATEPAKLTGGTLDVVHAYQPWGHMHLAAASTATGQSINIDDVNAEIADAATAIARDAGRTAEQRGVSVEVHALGAEPADALIETATRVSAG